MTQAEAIIAAFQKLGGERTIKEIEECVTVTYKYRWKDFGTRLADMVPLSRGGNKSSSVPDNFRILERISRGTYRLIKE